MKVIISPYSKLMRNGKRNPKNYPWWKEVVALLKDRGIFTIQIGVKGEELLGTDEVKFNQSLDELATLLVSCDTWISIDNFFPHFANLYNKPGIVIFGKSDPNIFGYPNNINLLKNRKYVRKYQFAPWEDESYEEEVFINPNVIIDTLLSGEKLWQSQDMLGISL